MSTTLDAARIATAQRATEFLTGTATASTTGDRITDTTNLNYADGYLNESFIRLTSGGASGSVRRISLYTGSNQTAVFYGSLSVSLASGTTYELYRRFHPTQDIPVAINRALNVAWPDFYSQNYALVTMTRDTLQYPYPSDLSVPNGLIGIDWQRWTEAANSTWPWERLSPDDYTSLLNYTGGAEVQTIQLNRNPNTNQMMRFVYGAPVPNVTLNTDPVNLDLPELEWLYTQATAELWRIEASRTTDASRTAALTEAARNDAYADKLRGSLGNTWPYKPVTRTRFRIGVGNYQTPWGN